MHRIRRRYRRVNGRFVASAVAAGLLLAAAHGHVPPASGQTASMVQPVGHTVPGRRDGDRLCPRPARQAVRVGRHRPGRGSTARGWS